MRHVYRYDPYTASFVMERRDLKFYLRKALVLGVPTMLMALLFTFGFYSLYETDRLRALKTSSQHLITANDSFFIKLATAERSVDELKAFDQQLHSSILDADPIEEDQVREDFLSLYKEVGINDLQAIEEKLQSIKDKLNTAEAHTTVRNLYNMSEAELRGIPTIRPLTTQIISGYGQRKHPITKVNRQHTGIDFKADEGTRVRATGDGVVEEVAHKNNGPGLYVVIRHSHGYKTRYAHLSRVIVKQGQRVTVKQTIGFSGNTGLSKGPHLHYEILHNDEPVDPIDYFFMDLPPDEYARVRESAHLYNESWD